jgi:hypothetical protein
MGWAYQQHELYLEGWTYSVVSLINFKLPDFGMARVESLNVTLPVQEIFKLVNPLYQRVLSEGKKNW